MMKKYTTVLTIAGSDGSGGAGIQADIKTFASLECYGLTVITTLTVQNTVGVHAVYPLSDQCVLEQFEAIAADIEINAVKIGMLGNGAIIKAVASLLKTLKGKPPVILDTILSSSSGTRILSKSAIELMQAELFPLASLITPNLPETAILTGAKRHPATMEEIEESARILQKRGAGAVMIKGGHRDGNECRDCLLHGQTFTWFSSKKILTCNTHGTGCTLSSAIAAFMAKGETIEVATGKAKQYLDEAMAAGKEYQLGKGNGPLHHLYSLWR